MPATPTDPMKEAMRLHGAGRIAEAEARYRRILAKQPVFAPALSYLGLLEQQSGRSAGLAHLRRAVELAPALAPLWLNYGLGLEGEGQFEQAELALRHAIALDSTLFEAHIALGANLRNRGRIDD